MLFMITTFMPNFKVKIFIPENKINNLPVCVVVRYFFIKDIEIVEVCKIIMLVD